MVMMMMMMMMMIMTTRFQSVVLYGLSGWSQIGLGISEPYPLSLSTPGRSQVLPWPLIRHGSSRCRVSSLPLC
jgi:hypothetical protein